MNDELTAEARNYYEHIRILNGYRLVLDEKLLNLEIAKRKARDRATKPKHKPLWEQKVAQRTNQVAELRKKCKAAEQQVAKIGIDMDYAGQPVPYRYTAKEVIEELQRTMREAEEDHMNVKWDVQNSIYEEFVDLLRVTGYGT